MRIVRDNTTAVIIDIQERLFPHIDNNKQILANIEILIRGLEVLEVPVLLTEQYTKGLGTTVQEVRACLSAYDPIEKMSFSCHDNEQFKSALNSTGKNQVIIAGIEAHVCVQQTVHDLIDDGYMPVVVENCVSSRNGHDKHIAIERMRAAGAIITTYESILLELCRISGTDQFKAISQLIK